MNALTVAALDERRKILSAKHAKIHGEESQAPRRQKLVAGRGRSLRSPENHKAAVRCE